MKRGEIRISSCSDLNKKKTELSYTMMVKKRKMGSFVGWLAGNYEEILPTLRILLKKCMILNETTQS